MTTATGRSGDTISVVIPCFDIADYVDECIESVVSQRGVGEVLVINDGSTDRTGEKIEQWATRDRRVIPIHQPNAGLGAARNVGVERAGGDFLFFVDGDDRLPTHAIERLHAALSSSGSDIATGSMSHFSGDRVWRTNFHGRVFDIDRPRTHLFEWPELITDQMACGKLFRRSFWDRNKLKFPESTLFEDAVLVTSAHCLSSATDVVAATTYHWRTREGSITSDRFQAGAIAQRFEVVADVDEFVRRHAPDHVWQAHGEKVVRHDLRLYARLAVRADDEHFHDLMAHAGPVIPQLHPTGVAQASGVAVLLARFVAAGNVVGARSCALMLTTSEGRSKREVLRGLRLPWPRHPITGLRVAAAALRSIV